MALKTSNNYLSRLQSAAFFFLLFFSIQAYPQDKTTEVNKIFGFATASTPGCACAITQNGNPLLNGAYGAADLERGIPIGEITRFDIGSTRKQFIAATILSLVQNKKLALSDDVRKYIPELPDYGHKITIDHLLTHTSGIRDWTGIRPLANGDPTALSLILRQRSLNFAPGEEWSYSNSGFVLLTEIAERISKISFSELIRQRVFNPLGMKMSTYISDMQQLIPNRAIGYAKDGSNWKASMYLGNDRGGGAIFSTVSDLITWNEALSSAKLGAFITGKLQEPAILNNGRKLGYARGLTLDPYRDTKLVWHSGGAAGYHTWIGRVPSQGLSIAIACNSDAMSTTSIANRLLALYANTGAVTVAEDGPPPTLTGDALAEANRYAGLYFNEQTGQPFTLAVDRDRFRVAGGPGLAPVSNGRFRRWANSVFFMSQDQFELNFRSPDWFELKSMEGKITRYRRAKAPSPTSAELQALAGRYTSEELDAFIEIAPANATLMIRLNNGPGNGFELKPADSDTFQLNNIFIRFVRDKAGRVIGLEFSNPVVSRIKFTRVK